MRYPYPGGNPNGENHMGQFGSPYPGQYPGNPGAAPSNYLVWSILITVGSLFFGCSSWISIPFGIVSIVKGSNVSSLWAQGHYQAAHQASQDARKWAWWATVVLIVGVVISIVLVVGYFVFLTAITASY